MKSHLSNNTLGFVDRVMTMTAGVLIYLLLAATNAIAQQGYAVGDKVGDTIQFFQYDITDNTGKWSPVGAPALQDEVKRKINNLKALTKAANDRTYAVGNQPDGSSLILYKESSTWVTQTIDNSPRKTLNAIAFSDKRGLAVGEDGTILSVDGFEGTWTQDKPAIKDLDKISLKGVYHTTHKKLGRVAYVAGSSGTLLVYSAKENKWDKLQLQITDDFKAVGGFTLNSGHNPSILVVAVGKAGIWCYSGVKRPFTTFTSLSKANIVAGSDVNDIPRGDITAVQVVSTTEFWIALSGDDSVYRFSRTNDDQTKFTITDFSKGTFKNISGLAVVQGPSDKQAWIVNTQGFIGYNTPIKKDNWQTVDRDDAAPKQLNNIRVVKFASKIQQGELPSPNTGTAGLTSVSITAVGFPAGNINPSNVHISLAADCQGDALGSTLASSVVSGKGDTKLISFLLPAGLDPGQYYISISDYADGDANFESGNCAVVNVVQ